jgi:predicted TIM-barrel fold metal-dependent hydrolase
MPAPTPRRDVLTALSLNDSVSTELKRLHGLGVQGIRFNLAHVARAFAEATPERCVWGSDWPHPPEQSTQLPDDALLFDLLSNWVPDEKARHRMLVDNPAVLQDFPRGA